MSETTETTKNDFSMSDEQENMTTQDVSEKLPEIIEQLSVSVKKAAAILREVGAIDPQTLKEIIDLLHGAMALFDPFANTYTSKDRTRLIGGGIKNLGFIETVHEGAVNNPQFVPPYLNMTEFSDSLLDFTRKRSLQTLLQQFTQQVSDSMLSSSDTAFHHALEYYNSVKEATRQRVPGAEAEYSLLSKYFKKSKPTKSGNPSTTSDE
jgi:hypothetical protein